MKNPVGFVYELFQQPLWVVVWVSALAAINLLSILFLEYALAKTILITFVFQFFVMMAMYMYFGFEKILGLAHILWFPLLGVIIFSISNSAEFFSYYLTVLAFFLLVSLIFDTYDVITFFKQRNT